MTASPGALATSLCAACTLQNAPPCGFKRRRAAYEEVDSRRHCTRAGSQQGQCVTEGRAYHIPMCGVQRWLRHCDAMSPVLRRLYTHRTSRQMIIPLRLGSVRPSVRPVGRWLWQLSPRGSRTTGLKRLLQ